MKSIFLLLLVLSGPASAAVSCATQSGGWNTTKVLDLVATPAAGVSSCPYVYTTGSDYVATQDAAIAAAVTAATAGGSTSTAETFDSDLFERAFGAALLLFITGLGIGLIISLLRKAR